MNSKKFNKVMFMVAIAVIIIVISTTMLLLNKQSAKTNELDENGTTTGVISLNIAQDQQEYASNGKISLNIINDSKNNSEE